jgi:hypothetical protein
VPVWHTIETDLLKAIRVRMDAFALCSMVVSRQFELPANEIALRDVSHREEETMSQPFYFPNVRRNRSRDGLGIARGVSVVTVMLFSPETKGKVFVPDLMKH